MRPTAAGARTRRCSCARREQRRRRRWDTLPPLTSVNRARRRAARRHGARRPAPAKEDARRVGARLPALRARHGRRAAVQDTWLWQMHASIPVEDATHATLWRQTLRWLVAGVPDRVELAAVDRRVPRPASRWSCAPTCATRTSSPSTAPPSSRASPRRPARASSAARVERRRATATYRRHVHARPRPARTSCVEREPARELAALRRGVALLADDRRGAARARSTSSPRMRAPLLRQARRRDGRPATTRRRRRRAARGPALRARRRHGNGGTRAVGHAHRLPAARGAARRGMGLSTPPGARIMAGARDASRGLCVALAAARSAHAQRRAAAPAQGRAPARVIVGASGEPAYAASLPSRGARDRRRGAHALRRSPTRTSSYLGEDPARAPARIAAASTRRTSSATFAQLRRARAPGDQRLDRASSATAAREGPTSRFNLPGPDMTAADFARLLAPFARQQRRVRERVERERRLRARARGAQPRHRHRDQVAARAERDALRAPLRRRARDAEARTSTRTARVLAARGVRLRASARSRARTRRTTGCSPSTRSSRTTATAWRPWSRESRRRDGRLAATIVLGGVPATSDPRGRR